MKFSITNFQFPNKELAKTKVRKILLNQFYRAVCVVALFLMAIIFIPSANHSLSYAASQADVDNLNAQIASLQTQLTAKKAEAKTFSDEVAVFDTQIQTIQLQINATQAQIDFQNSQIININGQISDNEAKLAIQRESLKEQLRVIYEESNTSTLELIASSNTFSDFVDRSEYLQTIQAKTKETIGTIKSLKQQLEDNKNNIEKKKQEITSLQQTQLGQKADLDRQRYSKALLLSQANSQGKSIQSLIASKNTELNNAHYALEHYVPSQNATDNSNNNKSGNQGGGQSHISSVPYFAQNSGWWAWIGINDANRPSGASPSYMYYLGCKVTSLAMIMKYWGRNVDPGTIAQDSRYFDVWYNWDLLSWGGVQSASGLTIDKSYNYTKAAQWAQNGKPFIASGRILGGNYDHSVVITGVDNSGRWVMNDPWQGPNKIFPLSPGQITDYVFVN